MLLQSLFVIAVLLCLVRNLLLTWLNLTRIPASIPWIGLRNEPFSRIGACGREIFSGLERMKAGYELVSSFLTLAPPYSQYDTHYASSSPSIPSAGNASPSPTQDSGHR